MQTIHSRRFAIIVVNILVSATAGWWALTAAASLHRLNAQAVEGEPSCGMPHAFATAFLVMALSLCAVAGLAWWAVARRAWYTAGSILLVLISLAGLGALLVLVSS